MATMKALVKREGAPGIWMERVPVPKAGTNEVLIEVEKTAICGTDLHIYNWDEWSQRTIKPPLVIGHEFVGRIAELGPGVINYELGDRVSAEGHITCGLCRNCRAGRRHLCVDTLGVGVNRDGAFAEYVVVPASNLWLIPAQVPSEIAAFFDPFGNAAHCALSFDIVGEDVLITGAGPIGIIAAGICRYMGARHVVVTDVNEYRLQLAGKMGATHLVNVERESLDDAMRAQDIHEGFDIGLEMSGNPRAFNDMLHHMYHGGKVALLGILPSKTQIDWDQVIFKGLQIKGIYGREMFETWYKMTQMVMGGLDLRPVGAGTENGRQQSSADKKGTRIYQGRWSLQGRARHHHAAGRGYPGQRRTRGHQLLRQQLSRSGGRSARHRGSEAGARRPRIRHGLGAFYLRYPGLAQISGVCCGQVLRHRRHNTLQLLL
jgi:threonine 3-dehydrogenase